MVLLYSIYLFLWFYSIYLVAMLLLYTFVAMVTDMSTIGVMV